MGPFQALSALALAGVLRETASPTSLPYAADKLVPWLKERLSDEGELVRVLELTWERTWRCLELILVGDRLLQKCQITSPASTERAAIAQLLQKFQQAFPLDHAALVAVRNDSLADFQRVRRAKEWGLREFLVERLAESVRRLTSGDLAVAQAETDLLLQSMANGFQQCKLTGLVRVTLAVGPSGPIVARLATLIATAALARAPQALWGADVVRQEGSVLQQRLALLALEELQRAHRDRLDSWLNDIAAQGAASATRSDDLYLEDEDDDLALDEDDSFAGAPETAPAGPPPPPAAPPPPPPVALPRPAAAAPPPPVRAAMPAPPPRRAARQETLGRIKSLQDAKEEAPADTSPLRRRANVRWFRTMNPQRMYPLTVVLAKGRVREVQVKGVAQAVSAEQLVISADNPFVTVRPVLPGVKVYPPEQTVDVTPDLVSVRFHVLAQTLGEVPDARVELYWRQRLLSKIDLPMKVRKQTLAVVVSVVGLLWPFFANAARTMGADENATKDFAMQALTEFLRWPYAVEAGLAVLAVAAVVFYWINRPRESSEDTDVLSVKPMSLEELLAEGQRCLAQEHWEVARSYFEDAVNVAPQSPEAKHGLQQAREKRHFPIWELSS